MADAAEIARALKARSAGRHKWMARCPAHDDRTPSLSISIGDNGKPLVRCHAGCAQDQVIAALKDRGLWNTGDNHTHPQIVTAQCSRDDDISRIKFAREVWGAATDPRGTAAESYLASRKLSLPPELSGEVLRFHPTCPWERDHVPCLVAAFRSIGGNTITGIHRIRLDQPDRWPKAERKMLGPVAGSAVKLDPAGKSLVVGEGVETCMAARQLGFRPVWAIGSCGGIKDFQPVDGVDALTILGENDNGANHRAAAECCRKWQPRNVDLFAPPAGFKDVNDIIMESKQ
jgi:hypothetical protein